MMFGEILVAEAEGAILAHSVKSGALRLKKGHPLTVEDCAALTSAGVETIIVARLEPDDVPEDEAALMLARSAAGGGLRVGPAFTGRCNLYAAAAGVLRVETAAMTAANAVDEALTIATPPAYARLGEGQLAATAKVIPYAAPREAVATAAKALAGALCLHPFSPLRTRLILTETPGMKASVLKKGGEAVRARLSSLGSDDVTERVVAHTLAGVEAALERADQAELFLILGGSATSDRRDVCPAAVTALGGVIERFGMPVDPGNLLAIGRLRGTTVVILPGCVRSPALNGADWVLERLAARLPVTGEDIAAMGVGGLLKEIPSRPQPREG